MPSSKQRPLDAAAGRDEHDFSQRRDGWEATVFDRAAYFAVVEMRGAPADQARPETRFTVFPWAARLARGRADACLYAVTASGRFALLDRDKWSEWETRWRTTQGLSTTASTPLHKPHRGIITGWRKTSAPAGLGYCVEGRMGGRSVLTTSILARDGAEVETLNWRYTLGVEIP